MENFWKNYSFLNSLSDSKKIILFLRKYIMKNSNIIDFKYHLRQYNNTYETTKQICSFLNKNISLKAKVILDFGSGAGSNLYFLRKKYKISKGFGFDNSPELVKIANQIMHQKKIKEIKFFVDDIEKRKNVKKKIKSKIDVVTILQVLSVLEDYKKVLNSATSLKPKFIAVSSLFWDGYLDFKIKVNFLEKNKKGIKKTAIYNIYSIYKYLEFMKSKGYKKNYIKKLNIKNLKFKNRKIMGSYTTNLNGKKTLITGPLIQNWYFILSKK